MHIAEWHPCVKSFRTRGNSIPLNERVHVSVCGASYRITPVIIAHNMALASATTPTAQTGCSYMRLYVMSVNGFILFLSLQRTRTALVRLFESLIIWLFPHIFFPIYLGSIRFSCGPILGAITQEQRSAFVFYTFACGCEKEKKTKKVKEGNGEALYGWKEQSTPSEIEKQSDESRLCINDAVERSNSKHGINYVAGIDFA